VWEHEDKTEKVPIQLQMVGPLSLEPALKLEFDPLTGTDLYTKVWLDATAAQSSTSSHFRW
jgi:hypothetical protein